MPPNDTPPEHAALRHIAVWLQLEPEQELVNEGIGVQLAHLLHGLRSVDKGQPVLHAPRWARRAVLQFLSFYGLEKTPARFFGPPAAQNARRELSSRMAIALLPAKRMAALGASYVLAAVPQGLALALYHPFRLALAIVSCFVCGAQTIMGSAMARAEDGLKRLAREITYGAMAKAIDTNHDIDACIVPVASWAYARYVRQKPVIAQLPDLVFADFPALYDELPNALNIERQTAWRVRMARHAALVVCPSVHVRDTHLLAFCIPRNKCKVVPHAPIDLSSYLQPLSTQARTDLRAAGREAARAFLEDTTWGTCFGGYADPSRTDNDGHGSRPHSLGRRQGVLTSRMLSLKRFGHSTHWLASIGRKGFDRAPILYFPTRNRPYKNISRALEAVKILKEKHGLDPLLLLTDSLDATPDLVRIVADGNLYGNVLCLPALSPTLHAAMYAAADLALAASQFEGGFPFLFGEALSVGTPIVMARIPVTVDALPKNLHDITLFDPLSVNDLTAALLRGLARRDELRERQTAFFKAWSSSRTWGHVAGEYLDACAEAVAAFRERRPALPSGGE